MNEDHLDWRLLAQYFSNSSPEATRRMEAWMTGDPIRREYVESLRSLWVAAGGKRSEWDVEAAWNEVAAKTGIEVPAFATLPEGKRTPGQGRGRQILPTIFLRV